MVQYLGIQIVFTKNRRVAPGGAPGQPLDPKDEEQIKIMRKRSEAELEAFQTLMNYNPSIAYGTAPMPDDVTEED